MKHLIVLIIATLLPVAAQAKEHEIVLSGLPIWDSAPLLHMVKHQPLMDKGIRFTFKPWRAPEELGAGLARHDINLASAPGMLAPIFAARGLNLTLLGSSAPTGNLTILSRAETGQIAVPFKGGMPDLILRTLASDPILAGRDIRYTGTPVEAMQLLLTGQVTAAFLAEPLVTVAQTLAETDLTASDTCDIWRATHDATYCPTTGVYLSAGVEQEEMQAIGQALAASYRALEVDPQRAAALLKAEFSVLQDAPLMPAFQRITPDFLPACETKALEETLHILAPIAPFQLTDGALPLAAC